MDYHRLTTNNVAEFQRFCNRVSEGAEARGLNEDELDKLLGH